MGSGRCSVTLQLSLERQRRGAVDRAAARGVDSPVLGAMPALGGRVKVCTAPICGGDHAPGLWFAGRGRHSCRHTIFAARRVFLAPKSKDRLGLDQALVGTPPRPNRERSPKQSTSGVSRAWPSLLSLSGRSRVSSDRPHRSAALIRITYHPKAKQLRSGANIEGCV